MARTRIPTGEPEIPPHVHIAKWMYYAVLKAMDGSMGAGSDDIDDKEGGVEVGQAREGSRRVMKVVRIRRAELL